MLPPSINRETTIEGIHISSVPEAKALYHASERIKMTICYCSVYDECWIARFKETRVQRVSACHPDPAVEFGD